MAIKKRDLAGSASWLEILGGASLAAFGSYAATQRIGWTPQTKLALGLLASGGQLALGAAAMFIEPRAGIALLTSGAITGIQFLTGSQSGMAQTTRPYLVPAIYGERNDGIAGALDRAEANLRAIQPPGIMLHTVTDEFIANGAAHTARVRSWVPGVEVWWGVADNYHFSAVQAGTMTAAQVQSLRLQTAQAAIANGVPILMWDREGDGANAPWCGNTPAFDTQGAVDSIAAVDALQVPWLIQGLTSYDHPTLHDNFTWRGNIGVKLYAWQVYWQEGATSIVPTGAGPRRLASAQASIATATRLGMVNAHARSMVYLEVHHGTVEDLGFVANSFAQTACWDMDLVDDNGLRFMQAMVALNRNGYRGIGAVSGYQAAKGFAVTGGLTDDVLAALGV